MIIGTTTLGCSANTLGLDIIKNILNKLGYCIEMVDERSAKNVDILLVSLYWVDQVIEFPAWLIRAKINPKNKKPVIVAGGSMLLNPWPLKGMFHYAIMGDGECEIAELIKRIINKNEIDDMPSVICGENIKKSCTIAVSPDLPMEHYIEDRNNKITRVEIARGCKMKCRFCQISHIKPYREIPPQVLRNLIYTSPTKNIALFAPDRGSYSGYEKIEEWCTRYGKRNMGTDIRLATLRKANIATNVRFGVEGFSEIGRKYVGKPCSNDLLISDVLHILRDVKTPKGKPITVLTWYMILGLPVEGEKEYAEFADTLRNIDNQCEGIKNKITIFLSCSDFLPSNHTPLEAEGKEIWTDHYKIWHKYKPRLKNITIAERGGTRGSSTRLAQLLVMRGGENSNKALFNISTNTKMSALLKDRSEEAGRSILSIIQKCGVDADGIINGYENESPWDNITI